jgi:hypothetical protein
MFFFTAKTESDQRPRLISFDTEVDANAARASTLVEFPTAEVGGVFEESHNYPSSFPHVMGIVTNLDGSEDLLWSDGVRTAKL